MPSLYAISEAAISGADGIPEVIVFIDFKTGTISSYAVGPSVEAYILNPAELDVEITHSAEVDVEIA